LLILDEMGYFPLDRMTAQFLFQLVSRRYGRGSIILTSNKSYGEWGDIFAESKTSGYPTAGAANSRYDH
jgi:DNA replication protein DnaC